MNNPNISKGGLIGGLVGSLASVKTHKPTDSTVRKAAKTGFLAGLGFALGVWIERLLQKRK